VTSTIGSSFPAPLPFFLCPAAAVVDAEDEEDEEEVVEEEEEGEVAAASPCNQRNPIVSASVIYPEVYPRIATNIAITSPAAVVISTVVSSTRAKTASTPNAKAMVAGCRIKALEAACRCWATESAISFRAGIISGGVAGRVVRGGREARGSEGGGESGEVDAFWEIERGEGLVRGLLKEGAVGVDIAEGGGERARWRFERRVVRKAGEGG